MANNQTQSQTRVPFVLSARFRASGPPTDAELQKWEDLERLLRAGIDSTKGEPVSCYKEGFAEYVEADLKNLNKKFAFAIGNHGAELSREQWEFILTHPASAPYDKLMICNGMAGTSKSTCMAMWLSLMYLNGVEWGVAVRTKGLVLAVMHKTVDTYVDSIKHIVESFTGLKVVREYGDQADILILEWFIKGCPDQFPVTRPKYMKDDEYNDLMELAAAIQESIRLTDGNRLDRFKHTAIWHILEKFGIIYEDSDGQPHFDFQFSKARFVHDDKTPSDGAEEYNSPQLGSRKRSRNSSTDHLGFTKRSKHSYVRRPNSREFPLPAKPDAYMQLEDLVKSFVVILKEKVSNDGWREEDAKEAMALLRCIKEAWLEEEAALLCSTISLIDRAEVTGWDASHIVLEEAHYVDNDDTFKVFKRFGGKFIYLVGDLYQPAPWKGKQNSSSQHHSNYRADSFFEMAITRGRQHVVLQESRRTDSRGLRMASALCYEGILTSGFDGDHAQHRQLMGFYEKVFSKSPTVGRELFINTRAGVEGQVGSTESTYNIGIINHVETLIFQLVTNGGFLPTDILVIAPYTAECRVYEQRFQRHYPVGGRPKVGTVLAVMGREAKIVIVSIARTKTMGFLNTKGFWEVELTRSRLATIIVANHDALHDSYVMANEDRREQYHFYREIVRWCIADNAYVVWPAKPKLVA